MKLITVILCLALASYADSDLLEMSQELWSRVINGGFLRLGRIDPLRVPIIKVDQSEGDTSYRVLLRNLEVSGLNNSKIESVQIVRGRLQSNLSDNEAGYVSYDEASDVDSIRYRFHTLIKEAKSNGEDRDLSASDRFEQFMLYDPADVRAAPEGDLLKAGTQNEQNRRYYNNFDSSTGVRRGYSQEQGEDTVFQLYRQPTYGDMRVVMNPTPKTPSQVRVVYTHNYHSTQGDLPRPCIGACKPNYASNVRSGAQNYPYQAQTQYPYGAESRYYQDRVNYNEQTTTPGYGIKAQFGGAQQTQFGVKAGQKGGIQYSANFGGNSQPVDQTPNQFSVKGNGSGVSYNANYKTGPFAVNAQSKDNYGNTAQPQPQNQFSAKGAPSAGINYSVDYKKGPFSVQGQSGEGYGTTGYPQNQYTGYSNKAYTGNYNAATYSDNYGSTVQPQYQFEAKKGSGPAVNYAFDYRKGPVPVQHGDYTTTGQPQYSYSAKDSGYSTAKQPQNQFSIKGGSSGLDYSGHYKAGPFSVEAQSGEAYGTTGQPQYSYSAKDSGYSTAKQPQNQFSIKGGNARLDYSGRYKAGPFSVEAQSGDDYGTTGQPQDQYPVKGGIQDQYPTNSASGHFAQHQNQFSVKTENQYGGQNGENYGSASNNYEVKGQAGGAKFSAGNSGVKGQSNNFGVNYSGSFNNGAFSLQAGNQRDEVKNRASPSTRYTEATTAQYFEEFEPYKSPEILLEKQPSYVDIVYASPARQGAKLRSGKFEEESDSDPRQFGFVDQESKNNHFGNYNYTEGKSLNYRNDAARIAVDTGRIKDLLRYAKEYQEEQGYYEEGMELVYHFGNLSNDSKSNEALTRTKRQHKNDSNEEDLMHVVVRLRIPQLSLKSNYALTGKVGNRQLRGSGLLSGNFTDVVAEFTVELKRVDNKTMIVRAARAKLVSKDRKLRLQGMDENGPLASILSHGLMAAEAVAAMIADDLATKTLNENNNAQTMIYKMYKNLPVIEKS